MAGQLHLAPSAKAQRAEKVSQRTTINVSLFVFFAFPSPLCGIAVGSDCKGDHPGSDENH